MDREMEDWYLRTIAPPEVYESDERPLTQDEKDEIAEMQWELENGR